MQKGTQIWSEPITTVQNAARVFSPLDQRLHLGRYSWTPQTIEAVLLMGVEIPSYRRAAEHFSRLTHVNCSKSSLQRLLNEYGGCLVDSQAKEAQAMVQVPKEETEVQWRSIPEPDSDCMNISMDGVMVNVLDEGWKEVKIAAISAVSHENDQSTGEVRTSLSP
jgi:hypothetical protein